MDKQLKIFWISTVTTFAICLIFGVTFILYAVIDGAVIHPGCQSISPDAPKIKDGYQPIYNDQNCFVGWLK